MLNIGDTVICGDTVGTVVGSNGNNIKIENNFGVQQIISPTQCQLVASIKDTLRIFEETLCAQVK